MDKAKKIQVECVELHENLTRKLKLNDRRVYYNLYLAVEKYPNLRNFAT